MDYYETVKYSKKTTNNKIGKSDRTRFQKCKPDALGCKNYETPEEIQASTVALKYYTTDFFHDTPCEARNLTNLSRGINFSDGYFSPASQINEDSHMRIGKFNDKKMCGSLSPFPVSVGSFTYGAVIDPVAEDNLVRSRTMRDRAACNPKDTHYYERSFAVFSDSVPNPFRDVNCFVQLDNSYRGGISVKGSTTKRYKRSGC